MDKDFDPGDPVSKYLKVYSQGTEAWFPDSRDCWILGKLVEKKHDKEDVELVFSINGRNEVSQNYSKAHRSRHLAN